MDVLADSSSDDEFCSAAPLLPLHTAADAAVVAAIDAADGSRTISKESLNLC